MFCDFAAAGFHACAQTKIHCKVLRRDLNDFPFSELERDLDSSCSPWSWERDSQYSPNVETPEGTIGLMNKSDLMKALSKDLNLPIRKAEEIVDKVFETMSNTLIDGERIEIRGFGSFSVRRYAGYVGRNPRTGEEKTVKPKKLPFFKVGKDFREKLNRE